MVKLSQITNQPNRICAIDASTNSLAFAIFDKDELEACGKIRFEGVNTYKKVGDAARKTGALFQHFDIQGVVIEQPVYLNSPKTMMDLTMVHGAIIAGILSNKRMPVRSVPPIAWQTFIGNGRLTTPEKTLIRSNNPGKSDSWYKTKEREFRKQRTIRFVNTIYDKNIDDNDVSDAVGIGHYAVHNLNKLFSVLG